MTLNEIQFLLIGAALVAVGVVASAIGEHIRGWRFAREYRREARRDDMAPEHKRERRNAPVHGVPVTDVPRDAKPSNDAAHHAMAKEVIAALAASGFPKRAAAAAVAACADHERVTLEIWMRAALRRCASSETVCS
jgi:hypothetical protein